VISKAEAVALRERLGIPVVEVGGTLVRVPPMPEEVTERMRDMPPISKVFLEAYRKTMSLGEAAELVGASTAMHVAWLRHWPNYRECFEIVDEEITIALEDALRDRAFNGFREERYAVDSEGNEVLKEVKVKHDPTFLKTALAARKPEVYGKEGGTGQTNIIVQVVNE
jgi:hypothetical protein